MNFRMLVQFNSSCHWNVIPSNKNRQQIPASTLDRGGEFCLSLSKNQSQGYKKILCTSKWVIPEKIHTSLTDGTLEILAGGGSRAIEIQVGGGGLDLKLFFGVIKNVTSVFQIFDFTEEKLPPNRRK